MTWAHQPKPEPVTKATTTTKIALPIAFPLATAGADGLCRFRQRLGLIAPVELVWSGLDAVGGHLASSAGKNERLAGHLLRHLRACLVFLSHRRRDCRGGARKTHPATHGLTARDHVLAGVQNLIRFHVVFPPFAREVARRRAFP